jgi:prenylcysteine oxidase/farnesylcysteine lyase
VLGGGISGSSIATFLKQEFSMTRNDGDITVDLYDKNDHFGGRIQTVHWIGNESKYQFELGASIVHESNYYMKAFARHLNLTIGNPSRTNTKLGIYDGNSFSYKSGSFSFINFFSFLFRYGIKDFLKLKLEVGKVADSFAQFYLIQNATELEQFFTEESSGIVAEDKRQSFSDLKSLLQSVDVYDLTQMSIEQFLMQRVGLASTSPLLRELIAAAVRVNYNQPLTTMNALAGAVGIIPLAKPDLFSVKEGNARIPELLIQRYVDNAFPSHTVHTVRKTTKGTFQLEGVRREVGTEESISFQSSEYDLVVVATALETAHLHFEQEDSGEYAVGNMTADLAPTTRRFKRTVATFVEGRLSPAYFHLSTDTQHTSLPGTLLTAEEEHGERQTDSGIDNIGFTSIGSYLRNEQRNTTIYKVFSHEPLSTVQLELMFEYIHRSDNRSEGFHTSSSSSSSSSEVHQGVFQKDWEAYPVYSAVEPVEQTTSFAPHRGVYYVNAFETAVSCMECMAVAAKNVALLVGKDLRARMTTNEVNRDAVPVEEEEVLKSEEKKEEL